MLSWFESFIFCTVFYAFVCNCFAGEGEMPSPENQVFNPIKRLCRITPQHIDTARRLLDENNFNRTATLKAFKEEYKNNVYMTFPRMKIIDGLMAQHIRQRYSHPFTTDELRKIIVSHENINFEKITFYQMALLDADFDFVKAMDIARKRLPESYTREDYLNKANESHRYIELLLHNYITQDLAEDPIAGEAGGG